MKKLIAISVVFALVAGVAFAVDLGATVIGDVTVLQAEGGSGSSSTVSAGGAMGRIRIDGSGEVADGKFGGYVRLDTSGSVGDTALFSEGYAWWKPIDQLKVIIGQHGDGFFEYNGNSCWGFYQSATDTGVTMRGDAAWGGAYGLWPFRMRQAFAEGFGAGGLALAITPVDMVSINIGLPFFNGGDIGDIFKATFAQVALDLSFGTLAFTYRGQAALENSEVFGYFSLTAIDNLQIDFGLGSNFNSGSNYDDRLNLGLAVKYSRDTWGIKFRSLFGIPITSDQDFGILFEVLPYFVINDSLRVFVAGGAAILSTSDIGAGAGWHVNPYIEVGEEWGPKFLAGVKVHQAGNIKSGATTTAPIVFELPIALIVSF